MEFTTYTLPITSSKPGKWDLPDKGFQNAEMLNLLQPIPVYSTVLQRCRAKYQLADFAKELPSPPLFAAACSAEGSDRHLCNRTCEVQKYSAPELILAKFGF